MHYICFVQTESFDGCRKFGISMNLLGYRKTLVKQKIILFSKGSMDLLARYSMASPLGVCTMAHMSQFIEVQHVYTVYSCLNCGTHAMIYRRTAFAVYSC